MTEKNNYNFVDTHCHMNLLIKKDFDTALTTQEIDQAKPIITEAYQAGVKQIINVGTNLIESKNCIALAQQYENLYAIVGIHPTDLQEDWREEFESIKKLITEKEKNKIVAIGEVGIDLYRPGYHLERQCDGFRQQIEYALSCDLPVVIHTRAAPEETLAILQDYKNTSLKGVIHCFPYDQSFADEVIKLNFYLGIGGVVTYPKNISLQKLIQQISLNHIVLETDAPFLPPQTIRGKQNRPSQILTIAQFIADLRKEPLATIAMMTTCNAQKLFKILPIL